MALYTSSAIDTIIIAGSKMALFVIIVQKKGRDRKIMVASPLYCKLHGQASAYIEASEIIVAFLQFKK